MPEIAQGRAISTLTTRNRVKRLQHIRNSANAEGWQRRAWARLEAEQQQHEEEQRRRAEEMERLSQLVAGYRRYAEKLQQKRVEIEDTLRTQSGKVADIPSGRKWLVLGYRRSRATTAQRVVLRCCEATTDDDSCQATALGVWATQGLERILDGCAYVFESDTDKYGRTTFWLPPVGPGKLSGLEIEIDPARVFQLEGRPQGLLEPDPGRCRPRPPAPGHLQALAEKEQKHQAQLEAEQRAQEQSRLLEAPANPKDTKKALDLPSSEYLCRRYASTTFRGAPRTLPLLVSASEDGEPATDLETPTYGYFLKGEVVVIGGIEALQKAHAPPALLPGHGVDDTSEEEGPPGCPCHSSQSERRLDHHGPAVDAKQHSPATPHGVELPRLPTQPFFGRFCAIRCSMVTPLAL